MRSWHCLPFLALLPALGSCGGASVTEVVVRIETDMAVPCELTDISVEFDPPVLNGESKAPGRYAIDKRLGEDVLPLQLTVVAEAGQMLEVTVRGWKDDTEVAKQVGTVELKADKSLMMAFDLSPDSETAPPVSSLTQRNLHAANMCPEVCNGQDDDGDDDIDEGVDNCEPCDNACTEDEVCSNNVCREEDVTRYEAVARTKNYVRACTIPGHVLLFSEGQSAGSATVALPENFGFLFYGRPVTHMRVGADGWISFNPSDSALSGQSQPIDDTDLPGDAIYPFWDDLKVLSRSSVCWGQQGAINGDPLKPSSVFISWTDLAFERADATQDSVNVTVELTHDHFIYVTYGNTTFPEIHQSVDPDNADGALATIGVRDVAALACSAAECGLDGKCMSGENEDKPCGFTPVPRLSDLLAGQGEAGDHTIRWQPRK